MTLDIEAIRKRAEAATPGPWEIERVPHAPERVGYINASSGPDGWRNAIVETDSGCYGPGPADADFIAHARTDIPALLARIAKLEEANTRASAELRHAWKGSQPEWENEACNWRRFDANLVSKAIGILERALSEGSETT